MIFRPTNNQQNQAGVSLMLAVLVLAAITAIVFSLTTIVFIELRSSGDVARTEPALYASVGVTEEALFQYKRYINERADGSTVNLMDVTQCTPVINDVCSLGGVTLTLPGTQPLVYASTPQLVTVYAGAKVTIPLYTLNDYTILYNDIILQLIPNGVTTNLKVYMNENSYSGTTTQVPAVGAEYSLSIGQSIDVTSSMAGGNQYDLVLDNTDGFQNFQVSIRSVDTNNVPLGLPFVGQRVLRVVADYAGLTRSYTVRIPVP